MKRMRLSALLSALALLALTGCAGPAAPTPGGGQEETGGQYAIGIVQILDHVALNEARDGFIAALADKGLTDGDNLTLDRKDANGDPSNCATIANQFVMDGKDLILAIATPAAQAAAAATTDIPILATAITSFEEAGLVDSDELPGGNVSGTSDLNPVTEQLDLLLTLCPEAQKIGFLYCSTEDNSRLQVQIGKAYLDSLGIAYTERTVSNQNEVQQATQSIVSECDAIYIPTDNIFAATVPLVREVTVEAGVPVVAGENAMVRAGLLASYGLTYYDIGYQAGLMAYDILVHGADISTMPVQVASSYEYCVNAEVAQELNIDIPAALQPYLYTPEG